MDKSDVHIISGPSCVGKSQFIEASLCDYEQVRFASQADCKMYPGMQYMFHYNILRPFDPSGNTGTKWPYRVISRWLNRFASHSTFPYRTEDGLKRLFAIPLTTIQATVLATPRRLLLERVNAREHMEPLNQEDLRPFKKSHWSDIYANVNIVAAYRSWISFLTESGIPYKIIDSSSEEYWEIEDCNALIHLLER